MSRLSDLASQARAAVQARRPAPEDHATQLMYYGNAEHMRRLDDNLAQVCETDRFAARLFDITFVQASRSEALNAHMQLLLTKYLIEKTRTGETHLYYAIEDGPDAL
jgi:hypothetical protein